MRIALLLGLLFCSFHSFSQIGYDCHNQSKQKADWKYLGPINQEDELQHQRFGAISCISVNPKDSNEIYAGGHTGSLMHTTNRGVSWQSLTDAVDVPIIGINDIIVDYNKRPHEILIATGSVNEWYDTPDFGIFKSTDGGKNWRQKITVQDGNIIQPAYYQFEKHKNEIFALAHKRIAYSNDNGSSWRILINQEMMLGGLPMKERELRHLYFEPSERILYFSTKQKYNSRGNENAKLYRFSMASQQATNLTASISKSYKTLKKNNGLEAIQIIPTSGNQLLIGASHHSSNEFYTYKYDYKKNKVIDYEIPNAGNINGGSLHWFHGMEQNKVNNKIQYLAGVYLYKSIDGGQTYKRLFDYSFGNNNVPHVDIKCMLITHHSADGESDHIYLGTDGGLSFSTNGGKSFRNLNGRELQLTQFYGLGSSPFNGKISAGSQDNSIISYIPEEKKWIYNVRGDGYDVAYSKIKPGIAYGQYNSRRMYSTKNDIVPFGKSMGMIKENSSNRKTIYTHPNGDVFFAGQSLFHLPKGESKWKEYRTPLVHKALSMAVSKTDPKLIYMAGLWSQLIKSTDGGATWTDISKSVVINGREHSSRIQSICISPYDDERVWIGLGYLGGYNNLCAESVRVVETSDGGRNWSDASYGLPVFSVHDIQFFEGSYESLLVATDKGVYFKRGSGHQWQLFNDNLPNCLIGELNINYCRGKLIAATYGRGLWETDLPLIKDKNPLIIRGNKKLSAPAGEALVLNQDLVLRGKSILTIDCPVYMPKGSKVKVKRKSQVQFTEKGKLINGCGNDWLGITEK